MRKLFAFALLAAFVQVGCEKGDSQQNNTTNYSLPHLSGIYYGNTYTETAGVYNYALILSNIEHAYDLATGDVLTTPQAIHLSLDLYSTTPSENYSVSFKVPNRRYTFDAEYGIAPGTVRAEYTNLLLFDNGGSAEGKTIYFVDGEVVVSDAMIEATLTAADGHTYHFVCNSSTVDNSNSFAAGAVSGEYSSLSSDLNLEYTSPDVYAENYGDYCFINKNYWIIYFDDIATGDDVVLEIIADKSKVFPVGTFEVSNNLNRGELIIPGYVDSKGEALFSWYIRWREGTTAISSAPIASGSATITDNGDGSYTASLNFKDDKGNAITGTCTATPYIEDLTSASQFSTMHKKMRPTEHRMTKPSLTRLLPAL